METSRIDSIDKVKRIRAMSGLSQVKFGMLYGIPRRTIESWESGNTVPPGYVLDLLDRVVREDFGKGPVSDNLK